MPQIIRSATLLIAVFATVLVSPAAWSQGNPRNIDFGDQIDELVTLTQNWSDEESNRFYNIPQGSRLMPYEWFLHLEEPDSDKRFLHPDHIRNLGYIPRKESEGNPDALPIGFVKDASYDDGTAGVGITCAACHTTQINHNGIAYLVDGGPTMGDMQTLMLRLADSLQNTAEQDDKFSRFVTSLYGSEDSERRRTTLRSALESVANSRTAYNARNFPNGNTHRFGHGRVDAFGAIFNEISVTFLGISDNAHPASAPVSYPCLWDAPQHDRVQWNGAAENRTSKLAELLFGTENVGSLGRNTGEVLGVFGHATIEDNELLLPRRYPSTVKKAWGMGTRHFVELA